MTKTNAQTAVATKTAAAKPKKVLGVEDIVIAGKPGKAPAKEKAELNRELNKIAAETGAPRANAQLARGIKAADAQQSAKAVADQNRAKPTNKADAATQKPAKAAEVKKAARKAEAEKAKGDRKYKVVTKLADITLRDGTWTKVMVETALGHTSTDAANAALAKNREFGSRKIDWKWLADVRKYIAFA